MQAFVNVCENSAEDSVGDTCAAMLVHVCVCECAKTLMRLASGTGTPALIAFCSWFCESYAYCHGPKACFFALGACRHGSHETLIHVYIRNIYIHMHITQQKMVFPTLSFPSDHAIVSAVLARVNQDDVFMPRKESVTASEWPVIIMNGESLPAPWVGRRDLGLLLPSMCMGVCLRMNASKHLLACFLNRFTRVWNVDFTRERSSGLVGERKLISCHYFSLWTHPCIWRMCVNDYWLSYACVPSANIRHWNQICDEVGVNVMPRAWVSVCHEFPCALCPYVHACVRPWERMYRSRSVLISFRALRVCK